MRLVRPALLASVLAAGSIATASPAGAAHCVAYAEPPLPSGGQSVGYGSVNCMSASDLTVMVCVEALRGTHWRIASCETESAYGTLVAAYAHACVQDAPLVRTYVLGTDGNGEYVTATSVPSLPGVGSCGP